MQQNQPANFKNRIGFVLASVGSAVGMGNIWMFPYRVGQYGGAAFLLIYFGFVALFGWVGLSGEFAFGRLTGTGPIGSYAYALRSRGKKGGGVLGAIPLLGSLGIAIGYAVIVGWVVRYCWGAVSGSLFAVGSEEYFGQITGPFGSLLWHGVVVLVTVLVLARGVLQGIEKVNRIIMPAFFVLFLVVAVYVGFLPGAAEGYRYLLIPQWEKLLDPMTWVMAMGQAFFSLSINGAGMLIYGSYMKKSEDIVHHSVMTALLDTLAALLAGFAILPAVFSFGIAPNSGPALMFITLPRVFQQMPGGRVLAVLFFLSVLFAGITSLINMLEAVSDCLGQGLGLPRTLSTLLVGAVVFGVGLFLEALPDMGAWMDLITIYIAPFGAVLGAVFIYWVLGLGPLRQELMLGRERPLWRGFGLLAHLYVVLTAAVWVLGIVYGGIG